MHTQMTVKREIFSKKKKKPYSHSDIPAYRNCVEIQKVQRMVRMFSMEVCIWRKF